MDLFLKGKVAIVTGSGLGIGRVSVLTLAAEGANVVVNDINQSVAEKTAEEARALGVKALAIKAGVDNQDEVNDLYKKVIEEFGRVDILINNAGRGVHWEAGKTPRPFYETEKEDWDYTVNLCLYGVFNCTRAVLPGMIKNQYGKIVNMISDAGRTGEAFMAAYSAAKGGIVAFQKALAREVGKFNINVNAVSAGATDTERILASREKLKNKMGDEDFKKRMEAMLKVYPIRRLGEPIDLARMCVFLSSDVSRHITGQTISVSGGFSMV
ncbi:MAG: 3-oxoacyl-ACP reductase FabG [Deltaproteobacteria bacterium]|nr:3-oxoacyl-ACP reductase FabG [Deltaproteobacteria bacterium]